MPVSNKNLSIILGELTAPGSPEPTKPLAERVKDRYTLGLWSHTLIDRRTFTGRIVHSIHNASITKTLRKYTPLGNPDDRLPIVYGNAMMQLTQQQSQALLPTQQCELFDFKYSHDVALDDEYEASVKQLIDLLRNNLPPEELPDTHWSKDPTKLSQLSYLRDCPEAAVETMNPKILSTIFDNASSRSQATIPELFTYLSQFIGRKNPHLNEAMQSWLKQAQETETRLQKCIAAGLPDKENDAKTQAKADLTKLAQDTAEKIRNLQPGQTHLIFAGTNPRALKLPNDYIDAEIMKHIQTFIEVDNTEELSQQICQAIIPEISKESNNILPPATQEHIKGVMRDGVIKYMFPRLSQSLLKNRSVLAQIALAPVELARMGIEQALIMMARDATDLFADKLTSLLENETYKKLKAAYLNNTLEENVTKELKTRIHEFLSSNRENILDRLESFSSFLPPMLVDAARTFTPVDFGASEQPMWFEVVRQPDEKYTLSIYASGIAATHHPLDSSQNKVAYQVPYTIANRTLSELDDNFFLRLFAFKAWPAWKPDARYDVADIHQWLQEVLNIGLWDVKKVPSSDAHTTTGRWGTLKAFMGHYLQFQNENEEKLFYFQIHKKALVDAWTLVRSDVKENVALANQIVALANQLCLEGLSLYESKLLNIDALQRLLATRMEIEKELNALKPVETAVKAESRIIPPEILPHLHSLFANASGDAAVVIKDLIVGTLGEEIEPVIDQFVEDLDNGLPPAGTTVSGLERLKRVVNLIMGTFLGISLGDFNIQRPSFISVVRIAMLVTRIALTILMPNYAWQLNSAWTIARVAYQVLKEGGDWAFPNVSKAIAKWKRRLVAEYLAQVIFDKEQIKHFNIVIKSWQSKITRAGVISYDLLPLKDSGIPQTFKRVKVTYDPTAIASLQQRVLNLSNPLKVYKYPTIDPRLEPFKEEIRPDNALQAMESWLKLSTLSDEGQQIKEPEAVRRFLNGQLKNLPVPDPNSDSDCWSGVADPESCARALTQLLVRLNHATYHSMELLTREGKYQCIINMYKGYAIIDKLARRCKEAHLDGFGVNPWPLAFWTKRVAFVEVDYEFHLQLRQVQRYFGIDPNKHYTNGEVEALAKNSLFFESQTREMMTSWLTDRDDSKLLWGDRAGKVNDTQYFTNLLKDPQIVQKLKIYGIPEEALTHQKLTALAADPSLANKRIAPEDELLFGKDPRKGILPPAFRYLQIANFLAHNVLTTERTKLDAIVNIDDCETEFEFRQNFARETLHAITLGFCFKKEEDSTLASPITYKRLPFNYTSIKPLGEDNVARRERMLPNYTVSCAHSDMTTVGNSSATDKMRLAIQNSLHIIPRTQSEIVNAPPEFTKLRDPKDMFFYRIINYFNWGIGNSCVLKDSSKSLRSLYEMMWAYKEDQAARTLSLMSQHKNKLTHQEDAIEYVALCGSLLLQGDVLVRQLETQPDFARALGEFFQLIAKGKSVFNIDARVALLKLGILVKAEVTSFLLMHPEVNLDPDKIFPDFSNLALTMLHPRLEYDTFSFEEGCRRVCAAGLLSLPYAFIKPENASPAKVKQAIFDICVAMLFSKRGYLSLKDDSHLNVTLEETDKQLYAYFLEALASWMPTISRMLDENIELRNEILSGIMKEKGHLTSTDFTWHGKFPEYFTGNGLQLNFLGTKAAVSTQDNTIRQQIKQNVDSIFGSTPYTLNTDGSNYRTSTPAFEEDVEIIVNEDRATGKYSLVYQIRQYDENIRKRTYHWISPDGMAPSGDNPETYWFSAESAPGKADPELLILEKGKVKERRKIRGLNLNGRSVDTWERVEIAQMSKSMLTVGNQPSDLIDLAKTAHQLESLTWFQPQADINAYRSLEPPYGITRIEFKKLKLKFDVQDVEGVPQAVSTGEYPGFYIAREQRQEARFPILKSHARYLLLEKCIVDKNTGERRFEHRILIPDDALYSAGIGWITQKTVLTLPQCAKVMIDGALAKKMPNIASAVMSTRSEPSTAFEYSIEDGRLVSTTSSPLAVLHLLCHSFAKESPVPPHLQSMDDTIFYLEEFERLANLKRLPDGALALCHEIEMAAPFSNNAELLAISLRLTAMRLKNTLVYSEIEKYSKKAKEFGSISFRTVSTIMLQVTFALAQRKPTRFIDLGLNPFQKERLLAQSKELSRELLIKIGLRIPEEAFFIIKKLRDAGLADLLFVTPEIDPLKSAENNAKLASILTPREFNLFRQICQNWNGEIGKFEDEHLINTDSTWETVPIAFDKIDEEAIRRNFHIYYRLARDELPPKHPADKIALFRDRARAFRRSLKFFHGANFKPNEMTLINMLREASNSRVMRFTHPDKLDEALLDFRNAYAEKQRLVQEGTHLFRVPLADYNLNTTRSEYLWLIEVIKSSALKAMFTQTTRRVTTNLVLSHGATVVKTLAASEIIHLMPHCVHLPGLAVTAGVASWRIYKYVKGGNEADQKAAIEPPAYQQMDMSPHMEGLQAEDNALAAMCRALLSNNFFAIEEEIKEGESDPDQSFTARTASDDPIIKQNFAHPNQNLSYGAPRSPHRTVYKYRSIEHLYILRTQLEKAIGSYKSTLAQQRERIIDFCTKRKRETRSDEVAIPALITKEGVESFAGKDDRLFMGMIHAFARGHDEWIRSHTALKSDNELLGFRLMIYRYLLKASRMQQLERALKIRNKIKTHHLESLETQVYLKQLTFELSRERPYDIACTPEQQVREYLVIEYGREVMLWEKQGTIFPKLLTGNVPRQVYEGDTGMGKTDFEKPLTSVHRADGTQVMTNLFPDSLAPENHEQLSRTAKKVFGQPTYVGGISRSKPLEERNLEAIHSMHLEAVFMRGALLDVKNSYLAIRALFIEAAHKCKKDKKNKALRGEYSYYAKLYKHSYEKERANIDEPHLLLRRNEELNHPLGQKYCEPQKFSNLTLEASQSPEVAVLIKINSITPVDEADYKTRVRPRLAKFLAASQQFNLSEEERKVLSEYFCENLETIPQWLRTHPQLEEFDHALGLTRDIVGKVLQFRVFVDHGPSENSEDLTSHPNHGKDLPNESATIKDPDEAQFKTIVLWMNKRLTRESQALELFDHLKKVALKESQDTGLEPDETHVGKVFAEWCENKCKISDSLPAKELLQFFNKRDNAIRLYVQQFVYTKMKFHKQNINGNAHNAVSMFPGFDAGTATLNHPGTLPTGSKALWNPGAIQNFINYMLKAEAKYWATETQDNTRPPPIVVFEKEKPAELVDEIMTEYFKPNSRMCAVGDGSALFVTLKNDVVAKRMLELAPPHIKGVVFFSDEHNKMIIERGSNTPRPIKESTVNENERIVYFDENHCTGQDIDLPVRGGLLVTYDKKTHQGKYAQEKGRARGCDTKDQFIVTGMTRPTSEYISPGRDPTQKELHALSQKNQDQDDAEENYKTIMQRMPDVLQSAIMLAMASRPDDVDFGIDCLKEFPSLLIQEVNDNRSKKYGKARVSMPVVKVLEALRKQYKDQASRSGFFRERELQEIERVLEGIGRDVPLPQFVEVCVDRDGIKPVLSDFGLIQQVVTTQDLQSDATQNVNEQADQNQDQNLHQNMNQNLNQDLDLQRSTFTDMLARPSLRENEPKWDPNTDYFANLSWMEFKQVGMSSSHKRAYIYRVRTTLMKSEDENLRQVADAFGGDMWWSNSWRGPLAGSSGQLAGLFSKLHKPILEVLVAYEKDAQGRVQVKIGAISQADATEFWRPQMEQDRKFGVRNPNVKLAIYDLGLDCIVATGGNALRNEELHSELPIMMQLAKCKFLAGQMHITLRKQGTEELDQKLMKEFTKWIEKHGLEPMKMLFRRCYAKGPGVRQGELSFLLARTIMKHNPFIAP